MTRPDLQARAAYYLAIWAEWYQTDDLSLGFPAKVPLLTTSGAYWDADDQMDFLDTAAARAADAVLQDIEPHYALAIMDRYLARVVRFRRHADAVVYAAHEAFAIHMAKRGFP
jgi:hypothetical protein